MLQRRAEVDAPGCRPDQPADKQVELAEKPAKEGKSEKEAKEAEEAAKAAANQAANQESLRKALAKLTKGGLAKGAPFFEKAWAKFQEAIDMLPESEKNKPLKPQQVRPYYTCSFLARRTRLHRFECGCQAGMQPCKEGCQSTSQHVGLSCVCYSSPCFLPLDSCKAGATWKQRPIIPGFSTLHAELAMLIGAMDWCRRELHLQRRTLMCGRTAK